MNNIILRTDSYKLTHWNQYPKGTTKNFAYLEARLGAKFPYTVFALLQPILRKYLCGNVVTRKVIEEAAELSKAHFGNESLFNRKGWEHILKAHQGRLPVRIKAVPEGTVVGVNNVLMTVENTDDECYWLTNALESVLLHVWYPTTVATLSHFTKGVIREALTKSADSDAGLNFMLHDFGYRGVSSDESAEMGGAAHLLNFLGTDTLPAIKLLADYYNDGNVNGIAYSVPATEHSIMTAMGRDGETGIVRRLIQEHPTGILSVVADSYDIYYFISNIMGVILKEEIEKRQGVFVVRPDSVTSLHPTPEAEMVWIADCLWAKFGGSVNSKGYRVLNPKVRMLWGDGIDLEGIQKILNTLMENKYSAENIATFGMGGGLLQKVNRDTQRFAFKSSYQVRDGQGYNIFKQPKDVSKASKQGRLKLVRANISGDLITVDESDPRPDELHTVFLNGKLMKTFTLDEIRKNASALWTPAKPAN